MRSAVVLPVPTVRYQAAHRRRIALRIGLGQARTVRSTPEVDPCVAERLALALQVLDRGSGSGGMQQQFRTEAFQAGQRGRLQLAVAEGDCVRVVGAAEPARASGVARVDEHDVATRTHLGQCGVEQKNEVAAGLAGTAGEHEQRIRLRARADRLGNGEMYGEAAATGVGVVARHRNRGAVQGIELAGQVTGLPRWCGRQAERHPEQGGQANPESPYAHQVASAWSLCL